MSPIFIPMFIPMDGAWTGTAGQFLLALGLFIFVSVWVFQIGLALIDMNFDPISRKEFLWRCVPIVPLVVAFIRKFRSLS